MTVDEIKTELERRGWSNADLAEKLGVGKSTVYRLINDGVATKALRRHIELLFSMPEMAVLVYKINLTEKQVEDLTAGEQFPDTEEGQRRKEEAVQMVLRHNAETLAALRKKGKYDEVLQQIYNVIDANRAALEAAENDEKGGQP